MFTAHHVQRVGIEGSGSFGRAVAVHLALCWQSDQPVAVVEVPTLMTSRERHGQLGKGKTDPVDALAIARITGGYVGFLGEEDEGTVRAAYPGPTWDRLRELKRRYDPNNLFRLNHNIPPADG